MLPNYDGHLNCRISPTITYVDSARKGVEPIFGNSLSASRTLQSVTFDPERL